MYDKLDGMELGLSAALVEDSAQQAESVINELAALFLISLALGVAIVSLRGNNVDLLHFLFGSVLALVPG